MLDGLALQTIENKGIDGGARPLLFPHSWNWRPLRWNEGPVALPGRTLFNPAADQINFRAGQLFAPHIGGRHTNGRIVGRDSPVNFAGARVAGDKSQAALVQL